MSRGCSVLYAAMVRNADEKERAKIDRQLDTAAMASELGPHRGTRRRHNHRQTSPQQPATPSLAPAAATEVQSGRFGVKKAPPGFEGAMTADEAGEVQSWMRQNKGG